MISASNDSQQQEQLIEKYMSLPNQVWDDIINQAAKNVSRKWLPLKKEWTNTAKIMSLFNKINSGILNLSVKYNSR